MAKTKIIIRTKQDYINLLNETVNYYSEDPDNRRALDINGNCRYYVKGRGMGQMCAVGRCLINPKDKDKILASNNSVTGLFGRFTDRVFKKEYRGFNEKFWGQLQELHDENSYWDEDGLSIDGKRRVKELRGFIKNDRYTN